MKMKFMLLLVLVILGIVSAYDQRCPEGLPYEIRTYGSNCYQFITREKYWTDADDYCRGHGGRFVTINNAATNNFITSVLNNDLRWGVNGVWIGLHDRRHEHNWEWSTEHPAQPESVTFSNWGTGHPGSLMNNMRDCVRMTRRSGWKWHETACALLNWRYRSICQYKMKPTTTTSTTSIPEVDLHQGKNSGQPTESQTTEEELTTEEFVWPTDNVVHILSSRNGKKLSGDSRKMEYIKNKDDGDFPEVQAQKDRKHLSNNNAMLIGIVVLAVSLIICLAIILLFIVYRRRKSKYTSARDSFSNPVYEGRGDPNLETPPPSMPTTPTHDPTVHLLKAGALPAMSCTEEGACGGDDSCAKLLEDEGKDCCSAPPSGNPRKQGRVQNEYVDSEQLKKMKPVSCRNMPVPPVPTKTDVLCKASDDTEVKDNHINNSIDGGYLDPKKTIDYMPMDSPKTTRANQDRHYDTPKPENIYAEIPERASQLLEDDEELYQSVA